MAKNKDLLVVDNLTKTYPGFLGRGGFTAVNGLSFSVHKGEVFGLLGPNGAGKSTLIKMLTGYHPPTSGRASVNGISITDRAHLRPLVGWAPQEDSFYRNLTVKENLIHFGSLYGLNKKELEKRADELIASFTLESKAHVRATSLSGGMKKRLNMAIALIHKPLVLYLDEPTVGVDPISRHDLWVVIERLRNEGVTILYCSHYLEEVDRLCDRVAVVKGGELVTIDTPKNLKSKYGRTLEDAFVALLSDDGKKSEKGKRSP